MKELVLAYDEMRKLADKKRLTAQDKALIETLAKEHGIALNKKCPNCYHDAAIQIALQLKPKESTEDGEYELRSGIDITLHSFRYGTIHVCAANCTPANARRWVEAGIPLNFFKKYPHDSNE